MSCEILFFFCKPDWMGAEALPVRAVGRLFPYHRYFPCFNSWTFFFFFIFRNEFRPWIDVKPVKAIKAKSQYKPPEEKMTHETSYSAQFKGETSKPAPADNKFLERRRIRTLYSEPYKEPPKVRNTAEGSQDHQCSWWDVSKAVRLGLNLPVLIPLAWHLHFGPAGAYRVPPRSWGLVEVDALWSQNFPVLSCKDVRVGPKWSSFALSFPRSLIWMAFSFPL